MTDGCPRCSVGPLATDSSEGIVYCENCGFVVDDVVLQHQSGYGGAPGMLVSNGDDGSAAGFVSGAGLHGVGSASVKLAEDRARRLRAKSDQLEAAASIIRLPKLAIQQAQDILHQVSTGNLVPLSGGSTISALIGACLYVAIRQESLGFTLVDVEAATATSFVDIAVVYRKVCRALSLELPSASLRSVLVRLAAEALKTVLSQPRVKAQRRLAPSHAPSPRTVLPNAASSHQDVPLRQHPTMKRALALADVVLMLQLHEGKSSRTVAGAILVIVCAVCHPGQMTAVIASQLAPCSQGSLGDCRKILELELLRLAAQLPMGRSINAGNLASYIDVLHAVALARAAVDSRTRIVAAEARESSLQAKEIPSPATATAVEAVTVLSEQEEGSPSQAAAATAATIATMVPSPTMERAPSAARAGNRHRSRVMAAVIPGSLGAAVPVEPAAAGTETARLQKVATVVVSDSAAVAAVAAAAAAEKENAAAIPNLEAVADTAAAAAAAAAAPSHPAAAMPHGKILPALRPVIEVAVEAAAAAAAPAVAAETYTTQAATQALPLSSSSPAKVVVPRLRARKRAQKDMPGAQQD